MNRKQRATLKASTGLGKLVWFKYKGTQVRYLLGTVEDVVSTIVSDYNHLIQRIRLTPETSRDWGGIKYAYRTGYYTLSKRTRKPVWGQYHQLIPEADYRTLARKACKKGWLGFKLKRLMTQ